MILVTGATGFVGNAVVHTLLGKAKQESVAVAVRRPGGKSWPQYVREHIVGDLDVSTDWSHALNRVTSVVHCAARVHIMHDSEVDPLAAFRRVNVDGTLRLARQAAAAGVSRFIFLSSIKVNGECTALDFPYTNEDDPAPIDPYGISKQETERELTVLAEQTGMEVVIIRPPLVYGPGVKANFYNMMKWLSKGVPLPFGAIHNKRSFVALDNLVDLIITCISHPAAPKQIFLVSDGVDLSTTELLQRIAIALGRPSRLLPVPQRVLESGFRLLGKDDLARRLCGSLQVDINNTRKILGWSPHLNIDEGLRITAEAFLRNM